MPIAPVSSPNSRTPPLKAATLDITSLPLTSAHISKNIQINYESHGQVAAPHPIVKLLSQGGLDATLVEFIGVGAGDLVDSGRVGPQEVLDRQMVGHRGEVHVPVPGLGRSLLNDVLGLGDRSDRGEGGFLAALLQDRLEAAVLLLHFLVVAPALVGRTGLQVFGHDFENLVLPSELPSFEVGLEPRQKLEVLDLLVGGPMSRTFGIVLPVILSGATQVGGRLQRLFWAFWTRLLVRLELEFEVFRGGLGGL